MGSECQISVKVSCIKSVTHTRVSYFTKLGTFGNKMRKEHPRKTSPDNESKMKSTVKRSATSSHKNSQFNIIKKLKSTYMHDFARF